MAKKKTCKACGTPLTREPFFNTSYRLLKFFFGKSVGFYTCGDCGWSAVIFRKLNIVLKPIHKSNISLSKQTSNEHPI